MAPASCIVITGASSGLGEALARRYAGQGVVLGLIARNTERLEAVAAACRALGARVDCAALDVGDAEPLGDWLRGFDAAHPIDLLICNAGVSAGSPDGVQSEGIDLATRLIRTNLLGAVHAVEAVAAAMQARGAGHIALIASTAAYRGQADMPAYSASKAGLRTYGEALRGLLEPSGVSVTVVTPSFFQSRMSDQFQGAKPLMLSTAAAAARVKRGLDARAARIAFPRRIVLLMQMLDLLPGRLGDAILRRNRFRITAP